MPIDIEEELTQHGSDLSMRAAQYIRIKRRAIEGMERELRRCREILDRPEVATARLLSVSTPKETLPVTPTTTLYPTKCARCGKAGESIFPPGSTAIYFCSYECAD